MLFFTSVGTGKTNIIHDLKFEIKVKQRGLALTDLRSGPDSGPATTFPPEPEPWKSL